MIVISESVMLNLGEGCWSTIEKIFMDVQITPDGPPETVPGVLFRFGGGLERPLPFRTPEERDRLWDVLRDRNDKINQREAILLSKMPGTTDAGLYVAPPGSRVRG